MIKAYLKSRHNNQLIAFLKQDEDNAKEEKLVSLRGNLYETSNYFEDSNFPDENFIAEFYIKWDGCSHFYFLGERYIVGEKDMADSYYHLCGLDSYYRLFVSQLFAFEVAKQAIGKDADMDDDVYIMKNIIDFHKNFEIEYVD